MHIQEVTELKIGFIGAGKVGTSMGKYFSMHGAELSGYYSKTDASSLEAAQFTNSKQYLHPQDLIADSDWIFITVTDGAIETVWNSIKHENLAGKFICHCSGSLSSGIFSDIQNYGAYGYSIHPLYAIPSKTKSYKDLSKTMFTVEGDETHLSEITDFLKSLGNRVQTIPTDCKAKYHAAAVFASNHMVGVAHVATTLLTQCGFEKEDALCAIAPMMEGNLAHILESGTVNALTGPVERNDITTVSKHINCLPDSYVTLYKELSKVLVTIGKERHPDFDYKELEKLL